MQKENINNYLIKELNSFQAAFDVSPVSQTQDARGLAIAWLSHFFKEQIQDKTITKILDYLEQVYHNENYETHAWYRLAGLEAAAYLLTKDEYYIERFLNHLSCSQSWARGYFHECASFIVNFLDFSNFALKSSVEANLRLRQAYSEQSLLILLYTKTTEADKRKWLLDLQVEEPELYSKIIELLKANDFLIRTDFFKDTFEKAKSRIIHQLLNHSFGQAKSPDLFDSIEDYDSLLKKEAEHPLNKSQFDLSYLK